MKKLAVLLPTYNAAPYLKESIDSVLNQTFTDFDLYVYDDCSTDESEKLIKTYVNTNIFYFKNEKNIGITKTLNKGLELLLSKYQYIARMDADDWCYPERFEKQIEFLDNNPSFVLCGTQGYWLKNIQDNPTEGWIYPTDTHYMRYYLLFGATLGHSSVIFRSTFMKDNDLRYDETKINCQDWELWTRISKVGKMVNLADFLMKYRILENSNHRSPEKLKMQFENRSHIIATYWANFGIQFSVDEIRDYYYDAVLVSKAEFKHKVEKLIMAFNTVYTQSLSELLVVDQKNFSYLLARKVLSYWKRSSVSRSNLILWLFIISKVKFMNKLKFVKSIIR